MILFFKFIRRDWQLSIRQIFQVKSLSILRETTWRLCIEKYLTCQKRIRKIFFVSFNGRQFRTFSFLLLSYLSINNSYEMSTFIPDVFVIEREIFTQRKDGRSNLSTLHRVIVCVLCCTGRYCM